MPVKMIVQSHHSLQKQAAIGMALLLAVLCVMCFALAVHAAQCPSPCVYVCVLLRGGRDMPGLRQQTTACHFYL